MEYEQVKKIIESCHLNFLIGSGASKPFLGTLSNIEQLLTDLSKVDESDQKKVVEASIKKHYLDIAIKGNLEIHSGTTDELTKTNEAYREFISSLFTILSRRKTTIISKQVNLFTTNMDLFLEYTMEKENCPYNDGFFGRLNPTFGTENFHNIIQKVSTYYENKSELPLFNVFKLHGSLNWKIDADKIVYDYSREILKKVSEIEIDNSDLLEIKSDSTVESLMRAAPTKKTIHEVFLSSYDNLVMINPTKQKFEITTRDLTFYELLRMYSNHLERANSVLFVIGFSFADEHIREITKRVGASNPTLLIIIFAFDDKAKENISKEISESHNIKIITNKESVYSLAKINKKYFVKLAKELNHDKEDEEEASDE